MKERARALKKTVLLSPSAANQKLWNKIRPLLGEHSELLLPPGKEERSGVLEGITVTGNFLLIGGNGAEHDESYFFTRGSEIRLKINIDAHSDEYISNDDGGDLVTVDGRLRYILDCVERMSCSNHMSYTKREGIPIVTVDAVTGSLVNLFQDSMGRFLRIAGSRAAGEGGKVGVTIDVDGIRGIPVLEKYESGQTTSAQRVLDFVQANIARIGALDVFGLVDDIPDFELNPDVNLAKPPKAKEMRRFREAAEGADIAKETLNRVGSYMAMFYAKLASMFLEKKD